MRSPYGERVRSRLTGLLKCELPIQLAPMGSVSVTAALPLAVARAGGHPVYPALGLPPRALAPVLDALGRVAAFGVNFLVPLMDHRSLELAPNGQRTSTSSSAKRIRPSSTPSTRAVPFAAGRSSRRRRRVGPRRPDATS
jgi:hypothetical protein